MRVVSRIALIAVALFVVAAPLTGQGFGQGVAVSDGQVLISERGGPVSTGSIFVYEKGADGWAVTQTLSPYGLSAGAGFGTSVYVYNDRMIAGGPGAAYIFERTDGTWSESATLQPGMLAEGMNFGTGGVVAGDVALVPAQGQSTRTGAGPAGMVYVFERTADGWVETGSIVSPESADGDGFGAVVLTNGQVAAISAPGAEVNNTQGAGAVYLFARGEDGSWSSAADPMTSPQVAQNAGFGSSMFPVESDSGLQFVIGEPRGAGGVGAAYAMAASENGFQLANVFFPTVVAPRQRGQVFANAILQVGDELWIGSGGVGPNGEGQVMRFGTGEAGAAIAGVLAASNGEPGDGFGGRLAADGDVAVVSANGKDYRWGTSYIFERQDGDWVEAAEVWTDGENYAAINGHEVGCEEGTSADFDCSEINILSFMPVSTLGGNRGVRVNDVWGWTDPQTGREYALVGLTDQTSFIDITDANNPRLVGTLAMTEGANGSTWRDIKVFKDHAFIVSDGAGDHGMQVFDLARLRDVGSEPVEFDMDAHYDGIASAHNIVINETTGFAYSVGSSGGGETCGGGLHMIDINEPTAPSFVGCFSDTNTGRRGTGYSHDAQCFNYQGPDTEHVGKEICMGSNETAISIADVTDKDNPIAISSASYPSVAYAHQGWVTEDHRFFYLGDELDELRTQFSGTRTMIFDITDLDDPILVKEHFGESTASDHNMYIVDNLLYQSNYNSGLRILDVSDPENPTEVGFLDTVPYAEGPSMGGSWSNYPYFASGTIIVTSGNEGLFMVKYQKPELVP